MTISRLVYTTSNGLLGVAAAQITRFAALSVTDANVLAFLGCTVQADAVVAAGTTLVRTIDLFFNATGEAQFPDNAAKTFATQNLYTSQLEMLSPATVTTVAPVII